MGGIIEKAKELGSKVKETVSVAVKDPVTWIVGGLVAYYAIGVHVGKKEGYKEGFKRGAEFGMLDMAHIYTDTLNRYNVRMPEDLYDDVCAGKVWFLEQPGTGA